jgi:exodeoxyribonuclease V gamma subunit
VAFRLYRSNRTETLAEALSRVAQQPLRNVFARECIVVQGPGMERWLSSVLATRLGIWANPWFPFPRAAVELILDAALGPAKEAAALFSPDALLFRLASALPQRLAEPRFSEVARYLRDDRDHVRLLAFSRKLAAAFDQYLVYRPELLLSWEEGAGDHFQAELWRSLSAEGAAHLARRMRTFSERGPELLDSEKLPPRLSLFGLSTLPPAFLHVMKLAAQRSDVHMFVLSPVRGYFGDLDRTQRHQNDTQGLVADLGKSCRDLFELLIESDLENDTVDAFVVPEAGHLLSGLQADLLDLVERGKTGLPARALLANDDSLRINSCHSRVRELEVLRDELRLRFERDATLSPGDVIVFAPDIELYAPAIEAVFAANGDEDEGAIPFRVADRKTQRASEVSSAFFALLDLLGSRLALSDVLDLLHRPLVRARFRIEESELDRVQHWLVAAGARWAIDAEHRESFGQPGFFENSLRFAIERLLLGYASAPGERSAAFGVMPFEAVEGQEAELLGRVARYFTQLAQLARESVAPRSVGAWSELLTRALAMFDNAGDYSLEHHLLRSTLSALAGEASDATFDQAVSREAVRALLEERLERTRLSAGFLAGGVTFCEHVPMRAIPFRVVCLLGMDDESFPRNSVRHSFDLLAEAPRRGDRNLRDDDRQLFLEALLSARDALLISYVGRSAQDDSARPVSALVEHVLRVIDRLFVPAAADNTLRLALEGNASQQLVREHALHRFDRRYFRAQGKGQFFSFDRRALEAARAQSSHGREPPAFVTRPLPLAESESPLSIETLIDYFRHPQRKFLKQRLSVHLPRELDPIEGREPTNLDALERYQIGSELLTELSGLEPHEQSRVLRQAGRLPPGTVGEVQLARIEGLVAEVLSAGDAGEARADHTFEIPLANNKLTGRLDGMHERARVERTVAKLRTKHKLNAWIRHLALCASCSEPQRTLLVGRDDDEAELLEFLPVSDARARLEELIDLYQLGMRMPLPYLHTPAQTFVDKLKKGDDEASALQAAALKALPASAAGQESDGDDAYVRQVFSLRQLEDLASMHAGDGARELGFADVARRILEPMLQHLANRSPS